MRALQPAIDRGFVGRVTVSKNTANLNYYETQPQLLFHHDRVQQAALAFAEDERAVVHLELGCNLINSQDDTDNNQTLWEAINQIISCRTVNY